MKLGQLLSGIYPLPTEQNCDITHLTLDSREVRPQSLFIALSGHQTDGKRFIQDAIARGAVAILSDASVSDCNVPLIVIPTLKTSIGKIAANFYDHPAKKLQMIGVTGTNGKTSIAHFIAQMMSELGTPCGLIGSLGRGFYGHLTDSDINTPDAISLQATLADLVGQGAKAVVMEVSSHGIDQDRIAGISFAIGIFTNLTQDHLDYHGTMENYAAVKYRFLASENVAQLIVNIDDDYGKKWAQHLQKQKPTYCYSLSSLTENDFNIFATNIRVTDQGIAAKLISPWGKGEFTAPLLGHFNISNVLAAVSALSLLNFSFTEIVNKVATLNPVPGRMQLLRHPQFPLVVVDHSHSPDSLAKALHVLRKLNQHKLICVFGCGGDRDRSKRPQMAAIVEQFADVVIVTSDNPRSEDPLMIIEEILSGFTDRSRVMVEPDREKAIKKSLQLAKPQDGILLAGKGAEKYQILGNKKIPFSDAEKINDLFATMDSV